MAIIHDVMPVFELFQPTTVDDTVALLEQYEKDAWVLAGGLDTFDWFKDRNKRRKVVVDLSGVAGAERREDDRRWRHRDRRDDHAHRRGEPSARQGEVSGC